MPQIQPYDDQILAQGGVGVRANPNDFGAQIGEGLQRFGAGLQDVGDVAFRYAAAQDSTKASTDIAAKRVELTDDLEKLRNTADPNDPDLVKNFLAQAETKLKPAEGSYATQHGNRAHQDMSAKLLSEFGQRAIALQSDLAAKDAQNKFTAMGQALGNAVFKDPSQLQSALAQAKTALDDRTSSYARIPGPVRDELWRHVKNSLNQAVVDRIVRDTPDQIIGSVAPETLAQSKAYENLLKTGAAPGAKVDVGPATLAQAPAIAHAAASKGVSPNIVAAQVDLAPNASPQQVASDMSKLVDKYGGDYAMAAAAYSIGADKLDGVLQQFGVLWADNLPASAQSYVQSVLEKSGSVSPANSELATLAPPAAVSRPAAASSIPAMAELTWEQQEHALNKAVQVQHMKLTLDSKIRDEQEYQQKKAQDAEMDKVLKQIIDPRQYGSIGDRDILDNSTLSWSQKQHMIDYRQTRRRELMAMAESRTNPAMVRKLMLQIHAADTDPTKTYNMDPVMDAYSKGQVSTNEMMLLRREVEQMRDGVSGGFQKKVHAAREAVYTALTRSVMGQAQPELAADAAYRFGFDMEQQIAAYRKENKDPSVLLDPMSREYMLKPERINSYLTAPSGVLRTGAGKVAQAAGVETTVKDGKTYYKWADGNWHTIPPAK